ncbi:hypothetical protein CEXT_26861 [Caerostris extrusa]|uniref:Uncharacterized protein n=1 Tax=Caerostris extrusa TaxID=172846 RepID=A0AAV4SLB8_CAEEX|nr:hypothetical protein CEXT_26861 [Caerostris extrusa]
MTKLSGLKASLFLKQLLDDINPSSLLECYNLSDEENCFTAGHTQTNQFPRPPRAPRAYLTRPEQFRAGKESVILFFSPRTFPPSNSID